MQSNKSRVGVDVGGTFTDFVLLDQSQIKIMKTPTSIDDQSLAILQGLDVLSVDDSTSIRHGTTIATNALIERRGAKTAIITTKGFADVIEIGRQDRPQLYAFSQSKRPPLVPKSLRYEVDERINHQGEIQHQLDTTTIGEIVDELRHNQVESVALALLFSFLNKTHEYHIGDLLREEIPDLPVTLSVDLLPEYREYERVATTVVNAYVRPLIMKYIKHLKDKLGGRTLHVMQSNGGTLSSDQASLEAARLVLSGPAAGVVGAFAVSQQAMGTQTPHIMTFDMGGTSTDVSLCHGRIPQTMDSVVGEMPLRLPSTEIHTVGAGGGSLARIDAGGILRVGPQSSGAIPGPVCYGHGGQIPTVTDANLVLGRLLATQFLGGKSSTVLDESAAYKSITKLAKSMELSTQETALGIVRIANATMERALRRVSMERGHDPRSYVLIPFGGAGPLHACEIAQSLNIHQIMIPRHPGVLSAIGLLTADLSSEASQAFISTTTDMVECTNQLRETIDQLEMIVLSRLSSNLSTPVVECSLDLRYIGQSYELTIPLKLPIDVKGIHAAVKQFHVDHNQRYGYSDSGLPVESVAIRLKARFPQILQISASQNQKTSPFNLSNLPQTSVCFDAGKLVKIRVIDRDLLPSGSRFHGPVLVTQYDSTVLITPGWDVTVDQWMNLHLNYRPDNEN